MSVAQHDYSMVVGGAWVESESGARVEATSPATGEVIGTIPSGTREDARRAIASANAGRRDWAARSAFERAAAMGRVAELVETRRDDLARTLTLDQGKPLHAEAYDEVDELVRALHPTPAVCGTPQIPARHAIEEIENLNRGFYSGAVGWCDASGDGEWAVTIRCAEVSPSEIRLFAGAGIVPGSTPDFRPISWLTPMAASTRHTTTNGMPAIENPLRSFMTLPP